MKKKDTLLIVGITAVVTLGTILLVAKHQRKRQEMHRKQTIADEGYETAFDILYPLERRQWRRPKSKFLKNRS